MATKLTKDVIRESNEESDGRNLIITLSGDQTVKIKLKGMKSGEVSISLIDLYNQLTGVETKVSDKEPPKVKRGKDMVNIDELRSMVHVTPMDMTNLVILDKVLLSLKNR